ncbi:MAG TPA: LLM class flavin-dependent oxidoreductase [Reyranella sp.]|jgi:5,10-methylenetetrahydromethanopterin reductase|nr:LLM class flavin-dependent oxidoreductase [Reyranella sp.]
MEPRKPALGIALWGTHPMPKLVEQVRIAEALGFESVWVIDSQLICRDIFVTLAACLAKTSRVAMATGVTQPRTRHVSATASALATLDEMHPGRLLAGVGTGFSSLRTIGMAAAKATELEAFVRSLRALLRKQKVEFENGVGGTVSWMEHPCIMPVVVAASGPRMTRLAASVGDGVILFQGVAADLLERGMGWLADGARQAGRAVEDLSVTCWTPLGAGRTSAAAVEDVRARVASSVMQANPDWFEGEERDALLRLRATYDDFKHAAVRPDHTALISNRMIERYAVAGDGIAIREQLQALMIQPCLDRIVLSAQGGSMPLDDVLRLLERTVLPGL